MTALIDTTVVLEKTTWVKDCNGDEVSHTERREVRCLAWDPMELTTADKRHLLALTIAHAEAANAIQA